MTGHDILDWIGMIPGIGMVADGTNAIWYLAEGDVVSASFSGMALIPVIGDALGAGKNVGKLAVKYGDDVAEVLVKYGDEVLSEVDEAVEVVQDVVKGGRTSGGVGNTDILIDQFTVSDVPTVRNGEFNDFFNALSVDELDTLWANPEIRDVIEARLRSPGGLHEWHMVSRAPQFKYWGVTAEQIKDLRTLTSDVKFTNPYGVHGGRGSTTAHNEILGIIDSSNNYETFVRRLNNWANYRLDGGVTSLLEGLQVK